VFNLNTRQARLPQRKHRKLLSAHLHLNPSTLNHFFTLSTPSNHSLHQISSILSGFNTQQSTSSHNDCHLLSTQHPATPSSLTTMCSTTFLTILTSLAMAVGMASASACSGDTSYKMCCSKRTFPPSIQVPHSPFKLNADMPCPPVSNYDLTIPATVCVPWNSVASCSSTGSNAATYFTTCCNYDALFEQTCATLNGVPTCKNTVVSGLMRGVLLTTEY
jgi:hypothetical protein